MDKALDLAVGQAMRESARLAILPRFTPGAPIAADWKAAGEAVTIADRESEAILAEKLTGLLPGARVVGEEAAHHEPEIMAHLAQGTCWIIDPLDGTANFAAGEGPFGILVALAEGGIPVGGWILDPLTGRFCAAQAGAGATIDGEPFRAGATRRERPQIAITRLFADAARRAAVFEVLSATCDVLDSPRCAADQYPRIALGENDATLFTRTIAWDHAAGVVFLNEAGGCAARPDGNPYRCDDAQGGLIAAADAQRWSNVARALSDAGITLAGAAVSA
ncbi:inositol monophosphatase family protein [Novosphingobium sp. P6W]|uniref:inositol monophosphatase family protein n=1 Tax=Novosphingobium sp. P6W TaxID=1609758 RepID=UPI000AA1111F|nr:inositol monophosphatase family protein [Novosphingobium sp. P6W]AXB80680.1 inositol monophosphatase [Novosphingobium sp. P6W]